MSENLYMCKRLLKFETSEMLELLFTTKKIRNNPILPPEMQRKFSKMFLGYIISYLQKMCKS